MPINDYECRECGLLNEFLTFPSDTPEDLIRECEECGERIDLNEEEPTPSAAAFKIKGLRAANGYGLKFMDTYGTSKTDGHESGYSFTGKGGTADHNQGQERKAAVEGII